MALDCRSSGSLGLLADDGMCSDVLCPIRSTIPARGAEELWRSGLSSTSLVAVFIFLLWIETNARLGQ